MAKVVDQYSTLEDFRLKFNSVAADVGEPRGLRSSLQNRGSLVDAINELEDKTFFFQEFQYTATASQTVFSGVDSDGNTLEFQTKKIQVFQKINADGSSKHLVEGTDYFASGANNGVYTSITLNSAASVNDTITIYAFTGSTVGTSAGGSGIGGQFSETAANVIYNINSSGVILNGDGANRTVQLSTSAPIEFDGEVYSQDHINLASGKLFKGNLQGNVTGNVTGNLTGNVTGNVVGDLTGDVTGTVSSLSNHSITALSDVSGTPSDGQILAYSSANSRYEPVDKDTTTTITEGTNLYFTNERVDDRVNALLQEGTGITLTYDDNANTLTISGSAQYGDSDVDSRLDANAGGSGLSSSGGTLSVNTSNGVKIDGDDVELDYEVVSTAPSSTSGTQVGHLWFVI